MLESKALTLATLTSFGWSPKRSKRNEVSETK